MPRVVDDLPNEMIQRISVFCCNDEGSAGRVLAQINHRWYINSRRAALQTISLRRGSHIIAFRDMINSLSPRARDEFRLINLFIQYPPGDKASEVKEDEYEGEYYLEGGGLSDGDEPEIQVSAQSTEAAVGAPNPNEDEQDWEVRKALLETLEAARYTLKLLAIHWTSKAPCFLEDLFVHLPALEELYLHRAWTSERYAAIKTSLHVPPLFPVLFRLQYSGYVEERTASGSDSKGIFSNFGNIVKDIAPSLVQLRIPAHLTRLEDPSSRLPDSVMAVTLDRTLDDIIKELGSLALDESEAVFSMRLFGKDDPAPKSIDFTTDAPEGSRVDGDAEVGEDDEDDDDDDDEVDPRLNNADLMESRWKDRVAGGNGPWKSVFQWP